MYPLRSLGSFTWNQVPCLARICTVAPAEAQVRTGASSAGLARTRTAEMMVPCGALGAVNPRSGALTHPVVPLGRRTLSHDGVVLSTQTRSPFLSVVMIAAERDGPLRRFNRMAFTCVEPWLLLSAALVSAC